MSVETLRKKARHRWSQSSGERVREVCLGQEFSEFDLCLGPSEFRRPGPRLDDDLADRLAVANVGQCLGRVFQGANR